MDISIMESEEQIIKKENNRGSLPKIINTSLAISNNQSLKPLAFGQINNNTRQVCPNGLEKQKWMQQNKLDIKMPEKNNFRQLYEKTSGHETIQQSNMKSNEVNEEENKEDHKNSLVELNMYHRNFKKIGEKGIVSEDKYTTNCWKSNDFDN